MVKLKWIGINIFRNYPALLKYYVLYNMVQPLNGFKSKYIYIFSLSITSEDFWSCFRIDALNFKSSRSIETSASVTAVTKGSRQKKDEILWHRVNFIWHLPTLPNYDIIFYDILVIFEAPTHLQVIMTFNKN